MGVHQRHPEGRLRRTVVDRTVVGTLIVLDWPLAVDTLVLQPMVVHTQVLHLMAEHTQVRFASGAVLGTVAVVVAFFRVIYFKFGGYYSRK